MKRICSVIMMIMMVSSLTGCIGPAKVDKYVEVKPNETAFVVPLEGDTGGQGKLMSSDYLNDMKVATKRIYLPQTKIDTGRGYWKYKWVPTVRVITVDRKPVTFVWEEESGIKVESKDSIGFTVGINITGHVTENDTALFLYNYPSGNIRTVLNDVVKSKTTEELSRLFSRYDLEGTKQVINKKGEVIVLFAPGARQQKGVIVDEAKESLVEYFSLQGVTIDTFGLIGGLSYEDKEIQKSINDNFRSELDIQNKENERLAQEKVNAKQIAQAEADRKSAEEFKMAAQSRKAMVSLEVDLLIAQAELEKAKRWDGKLPTNIMPQGSGFILNQ